MLKIMIQMRIPTAASGEKNWKGPPYALLPKMEFGKSLIRLVWLLPSQDIQWWTSRDRTGRFLLICRVA